MQASSDITIQLASTFSEIAPAQWDALCDDTPLLKHAFFSALESSGSIGQDTGWIPRPLLVLRGEALIGAMPLFIKTHSYGEYVFDWAWADAYVRNGLNYYPKLLSAIPFSPVTSARLLAADDDAKQRLISALEITMQQHRLSSTHVLFPHDRDAQAFETAGWLRRMGVQFRWQNKNYADFEDFLKSLSHDKRKRIRQERKKVAAAGVICRTIKGAQATESDWDFFYRCYCNTYAEHHSTPYLTRAFFSQIGQNMPEHIVLFVAEIDKKPVASTLNLYNKNTLFGRYWGATQFVSGLHFELCYYQAQQFCIAEKMAFFEGGAQGEHKLARGFEPRPTCSFHKIAHPDFEVAINHFLQRETASMAAYTDELNERAPFKHTQPLL